MATAMYQDSRENIATVFVGGGRGCGRDEVRANRKPPEAVIHRLLSCPPIHALDALEQHVAALSTLQYLGGLRQARQG